MLCDDKTIFIGYPSVAFEKSSRCRCKITGLKNKATNAAIWPNHNVPKVIFFCCVHLKNDGYNGNANTVLTVGTTVKMTKMSLLALY